MKKLLVMAALILLISGCSVKQENNVTYTSDTLYVKKVDISDDFIIGADISSIISLEESGVIFHDFEGNESDLFKVLSDSGFNYIRVRLWNNPFDGNENGYGGGDCDIERVVEIGKRATENNMKLLVDFHYSDFWADPGKQMVPKAWKRIDYEEKKQLLYEFTKESLERLKEEKVDVGIVQLGNETNNALCGETVWSNIIGLMIEGSKAVREVDESIKVAVHFANPERNDYDNYAYKLDYYDLDYDIFASSYYPYWHGTLENLQNQLDNISQTYDKDVMVVETSYAYTGEDTDFFGNTISKESNVRHDYPYTIQGQTNSIIDTIDTVNNMKRGIGVFYWEPAWITVGESSYEENSLLWEKYGSGWATSYARTYDENDAGKYYGGSAVDNQALFDEKGYPLESLKMFKLMKSGNEVELLVDAVEETYLECDINKLIELPKKINAIMSDNSKSEIDVIWETIDEEELKSKGVGKYTIKGKADNFETELVLSLIDYNYVSNPSFEEGDKGWIAIEEGNADELYVEDKQTDSLSGNKHFHFWSSKENSINFNLEQEINDLAEGTYQYSISIMGGDGGDTNIYSYVKVNGEVVETKESKITTYNNWDTPTIKNITINNGDVLTIGIHVECSGEASGAWGKIDDASLTKE